MDTTNEGESIGGMTLIVMLAFGYAVAESVTNALGIRVKYQPVRMYPEARVKRKKNV